jgi:hypothetical protein
MKLLLMTGIFFAGVYFGLSAEPDSELVYVVDQIKGLIYGDPE